MVGPGSLRAVMRRTRLLLLAVSLGLLSALLLPVFGVAATTETTVATEETVAETTIATKAPAVAIVEEPEAEELAPWTIRYLIPTSIVVAGLLIFGTVVQYFLKVVRTRYKTVE